MIVSALALIILDEILELVDGAAEDIDGFAADVAADLARAIESGSEALTDEVRAQMRALAEKHRVRMGNSAMATVHIVLNLILRTAAAVRG